MPLTVPRVVHRKVRLARWKGPAIRIVLVADLHACRPWTPARTVARIVRQVQALEGDMIALLGDYAGHILFARPEPPESIAGILSGLDAPLGVWAIFGNHDWYDDPVARAQPMAETVWHRAFADRGIAVLENENTRIECETGDLWLAGLGSQRALNRDRALPREGVDNIVAALDGIGSDDPVILLAHEPDIFPDLPDGVDLTLSGHTHAGQIRFGSFAPVVPSRHGRRYAYGQFEQDGRVLVVSAGLGYSGLPLRIGAPPEITVVEVGGPIGEPA